MAERGCARSRTSSRLAASNDTNQGLKQNDDRRRKTIRVLAGSLFNYKELESLIGLSTSGPPRPDDVFKRGGLMKKARQLWAYIFSSYLTMTSAQGRHSPCPSQERPGMWFHIILLRTPWHLVSLYPRKVSASKGYMSPEMSITIMHYR